MAGEDDYVIVARLTSRDEVDGGIQSAQRKLMGVERMGLRVGRSITSALGGAFAALGGGALFGGMARGIISINSELQQANAGMATLLSGIARMPIGDAIGVARQQVAGLRQDAAEGVGELGDYMRAFQMMMGPGLTGGASLEQLRTLTRTSLAAGFAQRGTAGLEQAPMDIVQALTSGVNDRQTPIALSALQAINFEAQKFNRLGMVEKIETLTRAFGAFEEGVTLMGQSWDAQMGTFRDQLRGLLVTATQPLFNRWSDQLKTANDWLIENKNSLMEIAEVAGQRLVKLWDHLIERAGTYASIVAGAALAPYAPAVGAMAGQAGAGMMAAGAFARRQATGMVAGVGSAYLIGGGGARGVAAGAGVLSQGALQGLGALGRGLTALGGIVARVAGPVALIATLFTGMYGALNEYPDLMLYLQDAWMMLMTAFGQLGESFAMLTGQGSIFNMIGAVMIGALTGLIFTISVVVKALAMLTTGFATVIRVIGIGLQSLWNFEDPRPKMAQALQEGQQLIQDILSTDIKIPRPKAVPDIGDQPFSSNITNNNFNGPISVVVQAESMDDPARVATTLDEVFDQARRNRTQARRGSGLVFRKA